MIGFDVARIVNGLTGHFYMLHDTAAVDPMLSDKKQATGLTNERVVS